jgi:hypothetical protein
VIFRTTLRKVRKKNQVFDDETEQNFKLNIWLQLATQFGEG